MKPDDVSRVRRLPAGALDFYKRTVSAGGEPGALDDARKLVRVGLIVVALFFGLFLVWAAFMPMSGAAVARGVVTTAGDRLAVQPSTSGVVSEVLVREGQAVRAGQILARMNGVSAGARQEQSESRRVALLAAQARLIAERDDLAQVAFPSEILLRQAEPVVAQSIANQSAIFARTRAVTVAERQIAGSRVAAGQAQVQGTRAQLALIEDELADIQSLYNLGFAPRSRLRALQRAQVELRTTLASTGATAAEADLERLRADADRARQTVDQLRIVQEGLAQTRPEARLTRAVAERDVLRAPFSGQVVNLTAVGPGSVAGSGQALMEIVPSGPALVVEARVRPEDVDDVRLGGPATVRLTSVNPHGRSSFDGRITTLSPDRITDPQTGQAYYLARIAVDGDQIQAANVDLRAGLPATVNLTTQRRTFLQYLFGPLSDAFSGAMREE